MKKALITGASSGIGLATAKLLVENGMHVTGVGRDFSQTEGVDMRRVVLDLAELPQLSEQLQQNPELNQNFDLLMLNAGYGHFGGLENFSHAQMRQLLDTNLVSNFYLLKHYLPVFKQQGRKDIIFIGSEAALHGARQGALYCASKFALRGLSQSIRADCAGSDIRVVLVNPGPVATNFFNELGFMPERGSDYSISAETVAETIVNVVNQDRSVVTEEINLQPLRRAFRKKQR